MAAVVYGGDESHGQHAMDASAAHSQDSLRAPVVDVLLLGEGLPRLELQRRDGSSGVHKHSTLNTQHSALSRGHWRGDSGFLRDKVQPGRRRIPRSGFPKLLQLNLLHIGAEQMTVYPPVAPT